MYLMNDMLSNLNKKRKQSINTSKSHKNGLVGGLIFHSCVYLHSSCCYFIHWVKVNKYSCWLVECTMCHITHIFFMTTSIASYVIFFQRFWKRDFGLKSEQCSRPINTWVTDNSFRVIMCFWSCNLIDRSTPSLMNQSFLKL